MFQLILRQLRKHWIGLLAIIVLWATASFLILGQRNAYTARLSHYFAGLPKAGVQDPAAAYRLVQSAKSRLTDGSLGWFCRMFDTESCLQERKRAPIRLDLMEKACRAVPMIHHGEPEVFRAHWLEKRDRWNLTPEAAAPSSQALVEPSPYWSANRPAVLLSLKDLLDASSYAYEIKAEIAGRAKGPMILVPRLFAEHARALCWDIGASFLWGDYARFQEERAEGRLREALKNYDHLYIFPDERTLAIARALRGEANYELALRQYLGPGPPPKGDPLGCGRGVLRLACVAPEEARSAYQKLLLLLPLERMQSIRYNLGLLYFMMGRRGDATALDRAATQFEAASAATATAPDARKNLVRLLLHRGKHQQAYEMLRELHLSGHRDPEYRTLARAVLFQMGRFKDADCFADEAGGLFGPRPHCRDLKL